MKFWRSRAGRLAGVLAVSSMLAGCALSGGGVADNGSAVTLKIESWRSDDVTAWGKIIKAFEKDHPDIKVEFDPTVATNYDAALVTRLKGDVAGDIITCRAFDGSLGLYKSGYLKSLNGLAGLKNYSASVLSAWQTDDKKTTFCVPMGGSIHGFLYNTAIFDKLGLQPPTTEQQFLDVLSAVKKDGRYTPLALGTADSWTDGELGYANIGPNYWQGEKGRQALIDGTQKFTDADFVAPFTALAKWAPYLPAGSQAVTYADAQQLFTSGKAAIYPAGSWEVAGFNKTADFKLGFFKAPLADGSEKPCYTNFHTDSGLGMNAATKHPKQVRTFLEWATTKNFATVFGNDLPGQIPLTTTKVAINDPTVKEFQSAVADCDSTIRVGYQFLDRGDPNTTVNIYDQSAAVLKGDETPEAAAAALQRGLDSWYKPSA